MNNNNPTTNRRAGRPPLPEHSRLSAWLGVRLTDSDMAALDTIAGPGGRGAAVRELIRREIRQSGEKA